MAGLEQPDLSMIIGSELDIAQRRPVCFLGAQELIITFNTTVCRMHSVLSPLTPRKVSVPWAWHLNNPRCCLVVTVVVAVVVDVGEVVPVVGVNVAVVVAETVFVVVTEVVGVNVSDVVGVLVSVVDVAVVVLEVVFVVLVGVVVGDVMSQSLNVPRM